MATRVVHVKDNAPEAVYIGRRNNRYGLAASIFANGFSLPRNATPAERAFVIEQYREWFLTGGGGPEVFRSLPELRDKALACWCRHDGEPRAEHNACHGDVLVDLLERYTDDELRQMANR